MVSVHTLRAGSNSSKFEARPVAEARVPSFGPISVARLDLYRKESLTATLNVGSFWKQDPMVLILRAKPSAPSLHPGRSRP